MKRSLQSMLIQTWGRVLFPWQRARFSRELAEELETHEFLKRQDLSRRGLDPRSAEETTRREMGNTTFHKEECRNLWTFLSIERFLQDLRYAARTFRRTPIFTAVAVASLALGIGGNAAMFTLVNALLVRPLPYSAPERLVRVTGIYPRAAVSFFEQRSRALDIAAVSTGSEMNLNGIGTAIRVVTSSASCNFLDVLGASVAKGRSFRPGEDLPGRDALVLISDSLWKEQFGADPAIIGRVVKVNGINRQIAGVMPAGFSYPSAKVQLWIPMRLDPSNFLEYWGAEFVPFIGRLGPHATLPDAQSEVRRLTSEFRKTFPYPMARDWNADSSVIPLQRDIVGDVRRKMIILLAAVGIVLLIACTNVASLMLSRATTRRKEIALRSSLGASRLRVIRQLLTESAGLALLGAGFGFIIGQGALSIFKSVLPASLPGLAQASMDWQVAGAVTILALLTGLAFGLASALSASQIDLADVIKTGSQRSTAGFWIRFRSALVVAEIALTLVLAITAGLLLKSLYALSHSSPGFDPDHVLTIRISPNQLSCVERTACIALYDRLVDQAAGISDVAAVSISNSVPLDGELPTLPIDVADHPKTADHPAPMVWFGAVTPRYFQMLQIRLLAGRYFTRADNANADRVALLSAATARRFWPRESALGKHIKPAGSNLWRTVVGVVADTDQYTLSTAVPGWLAGEIYLPYPQSEREDGLIPAAMTLLVQPVGDSARLRHRLEQLARNEDPNVPVGHVRLLEEIMRSSIRDFRATMRVFLSFAAVAMLLAAIGIYGLMSYWVSQKTYEIGLRVAIGATRERIVSMIFAQTFRLSALGILAGITTALGLTRFLASLLYGVAATDVSTFLIVTILVISVALIATAFPAWRAARIDPAQSLRAE
jgi:predicted permease